MIIDRFNTSISITNTSSLALHRPSAQKLLSQLSQLSQPDKQLVVSLSVIRRFSIRDTSFLAVLLEMSCDQF